MNEVKQPTPDLSAREKLFCNCYIEFSNPYDAAIAAGYSKEKAFETGSSLLQKQQVKRHIKKLRKQLSAISHETAKSALQRLAFGRTNDVIALVLSEEMPTDIEKLDLFGVSELKKVKGGGVEVKLTNRLDAIKLLYELENQSNDKNTTDSFFSALKNTASIMTEGDEVENGI